MSKVEWGKDMDTTIYTTSYGTNTSDWGDWTKPDYYTGTSYETTFTVKKPHVLPPELRCNARREVGYSEEQYGYGETYSCSKEKGHKGDHVSYQHHDLSMPVPQKTWTNHAYGDDPFAGA